LLILCIVFFAGFNYFSFAASDDGSSGKSSIANIDSDKDGLSDTEEALYGTAVDVADTDGDGYSDGVEVKSGYDPLRPAPGDKLTVENTAASVAQTTSSATDLTLTDSFTADFQAFLESKEGQVVSAADIKTFTESSLKANIANVDLSTFPTVEKNKLKIKSQSYAKLSVTARQEAIQQDAIIYLNQIVYLLESNAPVPIATADEFVAFREDFVNRFSEVSSSENVLYFADMKERLAVFLQQFNMLEVPETMVDLHLKFVRIINGVLSLQSADALISENKNDPMGKIVNLTKINDLMAIFSDFLSVELQAYLDKIEINGIN
ncbi:MAG: hypothetical protein WCJ51_02700, partial [Candidatus Moraniibacteriota bacterium]